MDRHPSLRVHLPGQSGAIEVTDTAGNGVRWLASPAMRIEGRQAHYEDAQGITWTYTTTAAGVKHHAIVTRSRGPRTYRFGYQLLGEQPAFTVDEDGNAVSGTWEVPRATVDDANGVHHLAGPWRVQGRVLAFDFDDTGIPTPYTIDPSIEPKAAANDWGATSSADTWTDAKGGTGSSTLAWVTSASSMEIGDTYQSGAPHPYSVGRYFLAFDTSQLRASDSIVAVYLYMGIQLDQSATDFTVKIREYDWVKPNNADQYLAEWQNCLSAPDSQYDRDWRNTDGLVAYPTPPPSMMYASAALRKEHINQSGKTRYCLLSERDWNDTAPNGAEYINAYSAGSGGDPYLLVLYDPATPTPTRTRTVTPTVTNTPTITRTPTITNTPVPVAGTPTRTPTRTPTPYPCDPGGMCPNPTCTITTSTTVPAGCDLDWSGKSVTVNSGVVIQDPDGGSGFSIEAASLTVNGTLKARGGALAITTTDTFNMGVPVAGAGTIDVKDGGSVTIAAGSDCTLNGATITADGLTAPMNGGNISITCPNAVGTGALSANGAGDASNCGHGGWIAVATNADSGKVVLSGTIDANSAGPMGFGGSVSIDAAAQLTLGRAINAKGTSGGIGGDVFLTAGGPAVIDGATVLTATAGGGFEGDGGWIFVQADSILVAAALDASGSSTYGGIGSTNQIICPCVKESNGSCTSACINEPIILGSSSPAYTLSRQDISRCD